MTARPNRAAEARKPSPAEIETWRRQIATASRRRDEVGEAIRRLDEVLGSTGRGSRRTANMDLPPGCRGPLRAVRRMLLAHRAFWGQRCRAAHRRWAPADKGRTTTHGIVERWVGEQVYTKVGREHYARRDGRVTDLILWESHCGDCGARFIVKVPVGARRFEPNRRCRACKRPGVPARPSPERPS
jgi:hypothetical protein